MRATLLLPTIATIATAALVGCDPLANQDMDLDGYTADVDCDDYDRSLRAPAIYYADADGDGWAAEGAEEVEACLPPEGFTRRVGDCDDTVGTINPSVSEACNGIDDDCDGFIDEGSSTGVWFADTDGDGFGDPETIVESCDGDSDGLVANSRDCDDSNPEVSPAADEICDGIDNNCDARVDEETAVDAIDWYIDRDEDGFGVSNSAVSACNAPTEAWTATPGDCNDADVRINPDMPELCDGFDNDCDGRIDGGEASDAPSWFPDGDRDGYGEDAGEVKSCFQPEGYIATGGDCDDRNRYLSPDTLWFYDGDADSFGDPDVSLTSCEDPSSGADTYVRDSRDCDDSDSAINPTGTEVCDGIDNDCDGAADGATATDATTFYMDFDGDGFGSKDRFGKACEAPPGFVTDSTDCDDDERYVYPGAPEFCDGQDNDCDGLVDRTDPDVTDMTWYRDADDDGFGRSDITLSQCERPEGYVLEDGDCADGNEDVNPDAEEVCDAGLDNDCDGLVDTADPDMTGDGTWYRDSDGDGLGDSDLSVKTCSERSGFVRNDNDCDDTDASLGHPRDCWDSALTFTTCGASGPFGPTQKACESAYSGTDLETAVSVSGGKQEWVVPFDGTFRIEAWGAASAATTYPSYTTGASKGARMRGDFELERGDVLYFAVGQKGTGAYYGSGGGGGSWVVDDNDDPLLIAGGGGGVYYFVGYYSSGRSGCPGLASEYAGRGSTSSSSGSCPVKTGNLGRGGTAYSSVGGGGGGLDSSGATNTRGTTGGGGWKNGLAGGAPTTSSSTYRGLGGFGGGGGAWYGGGGGGGYSGGNSGYLGGGGGSYNGGTNTSDASNAHAGDGKIVIDYVED